MHRNERKIPPQINKHAARLLGNLEYSISIECPDRCTFRDLLVKSFAAHLIYVTAAQITPVQLCSLKTDLLTLHEVK